MMVRRPLVALLLLIASLLAAPSAAAEPSARSEPPAGTAMLYSQRYVGEDGEYHYQLWVRRADGFRTAVVTDPWFQPYAADLSPDGRRVAMTVGRGSNASAGGLYVTGVDGSARRNLLAGSGQIVEARDPEWSPDGTRLVFVGFDTATQWDLWTVRADGTGLTRLTRCGCAWENRPQWSPDGTRILWSPHTYDVAVLDVATGASTQIYDHRLSGNVNIDSAIWAADGASVFVTAPSSWAASDLGLYSLPATGGRLSLLAQESGATMHSLVASPDGTAIGYTRTTSADTYTDAELAWIELAQPATIHVAAGPLREELLSWGLDCRCAPGGRFSALSLHTATMGGSIQAAGGLLPGLADQKIRLVIEHKPRRTWRALQKRTVRTSIDALYYADLVRSAGGLCRVTATWRGTAGHDPARVRSKPFAC